MTALAMTIAYGIALQMDWDKPHWAGFAVAFMSLSTIEQSLNKGAMRMLGTLLALVVSLLIIALFVQNRWLFMATLSGWIGFCTYRMGVNKRSYFSGKKGFYSPKTHPPVLYLRSYTHCSIFPVLHPTFYIY